jgi:hypothetical protein
MSKQKKKLKKNQVQVDSKIYDVNSPSYVQMYEDKFEGGDVVWDNLKEEFVSVPRNMDKEWDRFYKNQRVGKAQDKVRKGRGKFVKGAVQGVGTALAYTGEVMNTPLALMGEALSGRNDYYSALPNLTRAMKDMGLEGQLTSEDKKWLPNNDQMTPGALVSDNPLIQMGVDIPLDILTGKAFTKTSKYAKQLNKLQDVLPTLFKSKVPKINVTDINKFKNKTGIDYVKNVTSDPRYAQKAKELDVKYGDTSIQERPTNSNLTDQQQTTDFNPLARQLTLRETRTRKPFRNNDYSPFLRFGPFQQRNYFEDAAGPFTRMSNYTQTPGYYKNIFTNVDFTDEYLKNLKKSVDDLTTEELNEAQRQSRVLGRFTPGLNITQVSVDDALPHELKHKEHFTTKWRNQFPKKYKEAISQNFDETNVTDDYTKYRLEPVEQEAWLSRDLKKLMVDKGFIKSPFEQIDETTLDKFIKTDNDIFSPELFKRLNKPNFLKWLNEALPATTGVATAGTIGSQLMSQEESAPEQKANGGMIKRADGSYSQRGLWDNIRANKGSGKKPTKEMLAQEKKIKKKMAVGGEVKPNPIDPPNYKDRLQQYLSLSSKYRNMFTARSPLEYGLSTNGLDAGMYFNPMTNMPGMYGALNLNKKGFNLGAEKRIGLGENTTDINAGFSNDKFNVSGNLKRGTQGNEFGFSAGYNTPNLNIDASYSNAGGMPNVNANVGFNKNNFRGGLGYEYSGGNRLTGNVGYSKDAYDFGVSGMYSPTDSNINANLNYKIGTRKKQKTEPINIKSDKKPQEIKLINDNDEVSSGEAAFPMMNNKIPKMNWGGKLAPMLFDVGANALVNLTTKAVTDMVKAIREPEQEIRPTKPNTGFTMAYGGMIDPSMYMQQMMYGSYAQGGQVPQNIPVEVEGGEAYELPNGEMGEFEGPSHDNGGIPVALPEQTKVYSKQLKVNGKTMADRKTKREANVAKLEKILSKNPSDKFIKEALKRQQETAALEEQSDMAMQEQANQKQQMQQQAQQGMMQEQAMAGLMQDPAMMQQMGMMMYGGKLVNGTPPYGLLNYISPTLANAVNKQQYNKLIPTENLYGKDFQVMEDLEYDEQGNPMTVVYDDNMPKTKSVNTLNSKTKVADTNPPFFTEDQFNQLSNYQINPLDLRKNVGVDVTKPEPPGVNPYDAMNNIMGNTFENIALSKDPYINTKGGMIPNPLYNEVIGNKMLPEEDPKKPNKFMNFLNNAVDQTGDFFSGLFDKSGKPKKDKGTKSDKTKPGEGLDYTRGDLMGMAGTLFGGLAPATTTMLNRMMTPKNQNFFREFGAEGLRAMQEAQALSGINRDKQLADIKLGEEASRQRGRNSARGVNTLRAMDIAADMGANQAQNQAYNAYAQQMMQLLGQKAQMENQQDQAVMTGEYQRDLADRQDVDNFYSNLSENFASQSELMQKQGRDMNQAQYNKMILEMSPMFSKYGIGVEMRKGKYVMTHNGEDIDQTTARLIVEKGIEAEKKTALEKASTTTAPVIPNTPVNPATPNVPVAPVNSNIIPAINPLGLGNTPYFNPIFKDINIPTVTDKSMIKSATKRR